MELDQNTVVYPPNKNLARRVDFSQHPVIYNHLLFLDFNEKGESIVGSSSVNTTLWEGTTFYFNNEESLLSLDNYRMSYIGSTASDGKFLNNDTVVLAEDTGLLNILSLSHERSLMQPVNYYKHLDRIPKLAVWKNSSHVLTCSGNSVTVWDVESTSRKPLEKYENYHTGLVTFVDTFKNDHSMFVSAALDRICSIWDTRSKNPASVLFRHSFSSLTSVACNQYDTNYVVVATEGGEIYLLDRREPKEFICQAYSDSEIHRLAFDKRHNLAVCADSRRLLVFNCEDESLNEIYQNYKHSDIVRGLAWYNEALYSCGCDKKVFKHFLP